MDMIELINIYLNIFHVYMNTTCKYQATMVIIYFV